MDELREILTSDPCYEQHIVSIKDFYEKRLFSILTPAIYEGFQSLYKRAYEIEQKFVIMSKRNPDVENPGVLQLFQTLIREIPNLNNIRIRTETDRIKSSSKSAELFDDLVRAVCKANIILLTYNIDCKRKDLIRTKYHENIIVYDFIHCCYNYSALLFYGCPELFYHKMEPIVLNQNKRASFKIIRQGIEEAIATMLPMKEILLDYNSQPYEQKEKNYFYPVQGVLGVNPHVGNMDHLSSSLHQHSQLPSGVTQEEYVNVNQLLARDLQKYPIGPNNSLLEDDYDPTKINDNQNPDVNDTFGPDPYKIKPNDFSLLISEADSISATEDNNKNKSTSSSTSVSGSASTNTDDSDSESKSNNDNDNDNDNGNGGSTNMTSNVSDSTGGLKMVDISGSLTKRGAASAYFNETMPDIQKRKHEYIQNKKKSRQNSKTNNTNDDIKITRSQPAEIDVSSDSDKDKNRSKDSKKKDVKAVNIDNIVDNMLKP